jgi:glycosyltransferase involved in cell wall biosynthesis
VNVVHVTASDSAGGASVAAYRLHYGLRAAGHNSAMLVMQKRRDDPDVRAYAPPMQVTRRVRRRLRRMQIDRQLRRYRPSPEVGYEFFTDDCSAFDGANLYAQIPPCDVINLHWIGGMVDYGSFFPAVRQPVVWTLHDMNAFTGGCHYSAGCERFAAQCGACPQLNSDREADLSRAIWQRKQQAYAALPRERLHLVAPSQWLADQAQRSGLLPDVPVSVIPNGLDVDEFAPLDRGYARQALHIPASARVVLFLADLVTSQRKGFDLLMAALERLADVEDLFLLSLGVGRPPDLAVPHLHLGPLHHTGLLSLVYSGADLFAIPSREDNLPNTVLEAFACGTPVVGFAVGGIPEMVRPGLTGQLAAPGDVAGLADAMRTLLRDDEQRPALSAACRRVAVEEYSLPLQAERYAALYRSLVPSP